MGCPPDPVEVSIGRSGERIATLEEKYHRLIDEYAETQRLTSQTESVLATEQNLPPKEKFTRRTDVSPTEMEPYADDAAQHAMELGYAKRVKELENQLCELRTYLMHHGDKNAMAGQRKLHLAHRKEDRQTWIAWLKERINLLQFYLEDKATLPESRIDVAKTKAMIHDIVREIKRLEEIDDETLVRQRSILGVDEDRWSTPYLD